MAQHNNRCELLSFSGLAQRPLGEQEKVAAAVPIQFKPSPDTRPASGPSATVL